MNTVRNRSARVHKGTDNVGRIALFGLLLVLTLLAAATKLIAQDVTGASRGTIRPFVGAYVPTGDQRDFLKDAVLLGAQASWNATDIVALTASFGWASPKDKISAGDQTLDAFQYDLGLELRSPFTTLAGITPFIGAGAGARTYSYRDLNVDSKTNFDGYGALGADVGAGPVALRVEARDYVSRFQPLTGSGSTKTRNDIALLAGVGVRF